MSVLTTIEISNIRNYWLTATNEDIESCILTHEDIVEMYKRKMNHQREVIKVLETIMDERVI